MSERETENAFIHIRCSSGLLHRITHKAYGKGLTRSEFVREACIEKLAKEEADNERE